MITGTTFGNTFVSNFIKLCTTILNTYFIITSRIRNSKCILNLKIDAMKLLEIMKKEKLKYC